MAAAVLASAEAKDFTETGWKAVKAKVKENAEKTENLNPFFSNKTRRTAKNFIECKRGEGKTPPMRGETRVDPF